MSEKLSKEQVIAEILEREGFGAWINSDEAAIAVMVGLSVAGYNITPKPDDETKREVERIFTHFRDDLPAWMDAHDAFMEKTGRSDLRSYVRAAAYYLLLAYLGED